MVTLAGLLTKFESPSGWVGNVQWMLVQDVENYIAARVVAHSRHLVREKCRLTPRRCSYINRKEVESEIRVGPM